MELPAGGVLRVTTSVGVATTHPPAAGPRAGLLAEELVAEADAALYRAEAGGRDRVDVGEVTPPRR